MVNIDGRDLKERKLNDLKFKLDNLGSQLGLAVLQVGEDEASKVYIRQKENAAIALGYTYIHKHFPSDVTQEEVINEIELLNNNDRIDGIIVQMPLPKHLNESDIQNTIDPLKDVDGLTHVNAGKLVQNVPGLIPCTPKGIIDILDNYEIGIEGANVVVIGRSILVGKPIATLLTNRNATVVLTHSKTKDLASITRNADIIIAAVGKANFVTEDMVKDGAVVIDVGINRLDGKLCGDVDYNYVKDKCSYITPVPGGVGPMTVYELMNNVYEAHVLRKKAGK
jgi:methylenetetrahydrofolate dehydrogenase (NADP+)/methenyltetrahydrofolate cyclohydrolase